jgi:hypothetical protein
VPDYSISERFDKIERRLALLEGKPDPGLSCPGVPASHCAGGSVKVYDDDGLKWGWGRCPTCGGKGRVYPT